MRRYVTRRLLQNLVTLFLFLTLVYLLLDAQPGDFGNIYASDPRLTPAQRQQLRANLGLDKPVLVRYGLWLGNVVRGDFGISYSNYPRKVLDIIVERAPRTVILFISIQVLAYYVGFLMGKILAWKRGTRFEYASTIVGVTLYTIFVPWFALMMIWFFAYTLDLFPIGKFIDPIKWLNAPVDANYVFNRMLLTAFIASMIIFGWAIYARRLDPAKRRPALFGGIAVVLVARSLTGGRRCGYALDIVHHLMLPIATLAVASPGSCCSRNSVETLREDYIMAACQGCLKNRDKHMRAIPCCRSYIVCAAISFVLDGGIITETIFSWPGMGRTLLAAAQEQDIPMVIGALLLPGRWPCWATCLPISCRFSRSTHPLFVVGSEMTRYTRSLTAGERKVADWRYKIYDKTYGCSRCSTDTNRDWRTHPRRDPACDGNPAVAGALASNVARAAHKYRPLC
jgi:peptide/nickel transport system permease protein